MAATEVPARVSVPPVPSEFTSTVRQDSQSVDPQFVDPFNPQMFAMMTNQQHMQL